jgi:hypothetical protein
MTADEMDKYPSQVLRLETWSWWRRQLRHPSDVILKRIKSWDRLLELPKLDRGKVGLHTRLQNTFGCSVTPWDLLQHWETSDFVIADRLRRVVCGDISIFTSPHGPLIVQTTLDGFRMSITDVEGIGLSKSDMCPHQTVDAFGAVFMAELNDGERQRKGLPMLGFDQASLQEMCAHEGILNQGKSHHVSICAWDGRLFWDNSGGSHHFAAAAHISANLGEPVPLPCTLRLRQFNEATVKWLLESFHLILVPSRVDSAVLFAVEGLIGAGSCTELAGRIGDGSIAAIPRGTPLADLLKVELLNQGYLDFGAELAYACDEQIRFLITNGQRWTAYLQAANDPAGKSKVA